MRSSRAGLESKNHSLLPIHHLKSTVAAVLLLFVLFSAIPSIIPLVNAAPAPVSAHPTLPETRFSCIDATHDLYAGRGGRTVGVSVYADTAQNHSFMSDVSVDHTPHQSTGSGGSLSERTDTETEMVFLVRRKSIAAKIRGAFHKLGHKIKHAFQKVGHAIKTAAKKVGHFLKTTGAKIAKVGLKIVATVGKVVGKVVGFIPGAKGIGKAIDGASEGLNKASDAIHAHIGGKLGKAMKRMDKAQKYVGYIP